MENKSKKTSHISLFSALLFFIALIAGYLEAGGWGIVGGLLFWALSSLVTLFGLIPFLGPIIYYFVANWLAGAISGLLGVSIPITIGIVLWCNMILAVIMCLIITLALIISMRG